MVADVEKWHIGLLEYHPLHFIQQQGSQSNWVAILGVLCSIIPCYPKVRTQWAYLGRTTAHES